MFQWIKYNCFVFVQARLAGRAGLSSGFSEYDEYVPMVDKTVDVAWKEKQVTTHNSYGTTGWTRDMQLLNLICPIICIWNIFNMVVVLYNFHIFSKN